MEVRGQLRCWSPHVQEGASSRVSLCLPGYVAWGLLGVLLSLAPTLLSECGPCRHSPHAAFHGVWSSELWSCGCMTSILLTEPSPWLSVTAVGTPPPKRRAEYFYLSDLTVLISHWNLPQPYVLPLIYALA